MNNFSPGKMEYVRRITLMQLALERDDMLVALKWARLSNCTKYFKKELAERTKRKLDNRPE